MIAYDANKRLCALAWTHLHVTTTGDVAPCGQYNLSSTDRYPLLRIQDHTLEECINSVGLKHIRSTMLNNEPNDMCSLCEYKMQNNIESTKDRSNQLFLEQTKPAIEKTNADGSINIDDFKPVFMDIRFGNLCNLKCRMCNLNASSAWFAETLKITELQKTSDTRFAQAEADQNSLKFIANGAYEKIEHLLNYVERMYFAGGEPLLMEDHYKALSYLIKTGRAKDVELHYSTNYTVSKYKNKLLADYWQHFKLVIVAGSADGIEEVSDYIRTGSSWDKIKQIASELKPNGDEYRNIILSPCFSVSILNIFHAPRFFKWCFENSWFEPNIKTMAINYVDYPPDLSIKILPAFAKALIATQFAELTQWLIQHDHPDSAVTVNEIITYMTATMPSDDDIDSNMTQAKTRLDTYDISGELNWKIALPELAEVMNTYFESGCGR